MEGEIQTAPESTVTPPTPEASIKGEEAKVENMGKNLINIKVNEVNAELDAAGKDKEKRIEVLKNDGKKWLFMAAHPEVLTEEELSGGKPAQIECKGKFCTIASIAIKDDNTYICKLKGVDGEVEALKDDIRSIFLVEGKEHILTLFEGDERSVVEEYINTLGSKEKSPEDDVIEKERSKLEEKLKKEKLTDRDQQLLRVLRVAEVSDGEGGAVVKNKALEFLRGSGVLKLDEAFESIGQKVPGAMDYLKGQGLSEADVAAALNTLGTQDAENTLNQLSKEFLGKEFKDLTNDEIKKLLNTEKKKGIKDSLLLALLLAAIGPYNFMEQTIPMKPS